MRFSATVVAAALLGLAAGALGTTAQAATFTASSCARDDVQTAIGAASDGDTVAIPDGSCSWSSGISTTKQIIVRAQNYTPTPRGSTTRRVVITNNSTSPLFEFTSGDGFHVGLVGIQFNEGTGSVNHLRLNGSGTKVPLVADCTFEIKNRFGNNPDINAVAILSQGGVFWNCHWVGVGGGLGGQCCPEGASIQVSSPRSWATASTMGNLDVNGTVNVYVEDSSLVNIGQSPDIDDRGRLVMRHCLLDGASGLTHGFTSPWGGRHFEYYNNTFSVTHSNRNISARYFWLRAGTKPAPAPPPTAFRMAGTPSFT